MLFNESRILAVDYQPWVWTIDRVLQIASQYSKFQKLVLIMLEHRPKSNEPCLKRSNLVCLGAKTKARQPLSPPLFLRRMRLPNLRLPAQDYLVTLVKNFSKNCQVSVNHAQAHTSVTFQDLGPYNYDLFDYISSKVVRDFRRLKRQEDVDIYCLDIYLVTYDTGKEV